MSPSADERTHLTQVGLKLSPLRSNMQAQITLLVVTTCILILHKRSVRADVSLQKCFRCFSSPPEMEHRTPITSNRYCGKFSSRRLVQGTNSGWRHFIFFQKSETDNFWLEKRRIRHLKTSVLSGATGETCIRYRYTRYVSIITTSILSLSMDKANMEAFCSWQHAARGTTESVLEKDLITLGDDCQVLYSVEQCLEE